MLIQSGRVFQTIQLLLIICIDIDLTIGNNPHLPSLYLISLTRVMLKEIIFIYLHSRCWYLSHEYLFLFYFFYQKVGIHALAQAQKLLSFFPSKYSLKRQNRKPSTDNLELERFKSMMISTYGQLTANVQQPRQRENKSILFCFPREREHFVLHVHNSSTERKTISGWGHLISMSRLI